MTESQLSPYQKRIVESTKRIVLATGGPGTGKTTTSLWAARSFLERPSTATWQRVLFLTFSRTAVAQIARATPGVFEVDPHRVEISTFHGFAWRLIRGFGKYAGHGSKIPALQSEARAKLLGHDGSSLTYQDLVPACRRILSSQRLQALVARRWPFVICDEFQDTSNDQWEILRILGKQAQLLLLCDPNQMIYTFLAKAGVGRHRLEAARKLAEDIIDLGSDSHRDSTNVIPRMAEAIRLRDFNSNSVVDAVAKGKLEVVRRIDDANLVAVIRTKVKELRRAGARTIGIFGHSNHGVAVLGTALTEAGLNHMLIGIPEAHPEALSTLAAMCGYALGLTTSKEVRIGFASFLTASTRSPKPPELAVALASGKPLPPGFETGLKEFESELRKAKTGTIGELVTIASNGWKAIRITSGLRPWRRACLEFAGLARPLSHLDVTPESVRLLMSAVDRRKSNALIDHEVTGKGLVQLMNFFQTKGREADAVILVYRSGDYLADRAASEPFEDASRVLFVSITRARQKVVIILPDYPHALIAPFEAFAA